MDSKKTDGIGITLCKKLLKFSHATNNILTLDIPHAPTAMYKWYTDYQEKYEKINKMYIKFNRIAKEKIVELSPQATSKFKLLGLCDAFTKSSEAEEYKKTIDEYVNIVSGISQDKFTQLPITPFRNIVDKLSLYQKYKNPK